MHFLTDNGQSKEINPRLAANVMFVNPEQRKSFLTGLDAQDQLKASMPQTRGPLDVIGNIFHPEGQAASGQIIDSAGAALGGGEEGKKAIRRILNGPGSKQSKFKKITALIQSNAQVNEAQKLGGGNG
jgi:hypothetical protein